MSQDYRPDLNLATRAPEFDAMEDESLETPITMTTPTTFPTSTSSEDPNIITKTTTTTQTTIPKPTLGEHCTTDRPLADPNQRSTGEMIKYNDSIETYISKPADYPSTPAKLLLLLTNGRGVHSLNNQLQADHYAQHGFVVVMPDLFGGDPAPTTATEVVQEDSWLDSIKARVVETSKSFMIDMWLARHGVEKVMPILLQVLEKVRDEFADAVVHGGGGVYAVGYCFGGKYVLLLAGEGADSDLQGQEGNEEEVEEGMVRKGPEIKCGVVAHGTLVTREDLKGIKVPVSLVCVENDPLFPEEILDYGRKELGTANVKHEIKVYPGVPHGFAVMGEYDSSTIKQAQEAASSQMLEWLQSH